MCSFIKVEWYLTKYNKYYKSYLYPFLVPLKIIAYIAAIHNWIVYETTTCTAHTEVPILLGIPAPFFDS